MNDAIPKIIHVSWKNKSFLSSTNLLIINGMRRLRDLNPEWDFQISDDNDVNRYLKKHLQAKDWSLLRDRHIVEKVDVWRLLKMNIEGGCYCDIDRLCNSSLDALIAEDVTIVLPVYRDYDFSQDFMCGVSQHNVYSRALSLNLERRRQGFADILFLGPVTYFHSVTEFLVGHQLERGSRIATLRRICRSTPTISTYDETSDTDTYIHRDADFSCLEDTSQLKGDFYRDSGVAHWTVTNPPTSLSIKTS